VLELMTGQVSGSFCWMARACLYHRVITWQEMQI